MEGKCPDYVHGKSLDTMNTASLNELLQMEIEANHDVDVEQIRGILAVFNERTEQDMVDVNAAWDDFLHNHLPYTPIYPMQGETKTKKRGTHRKRLFRVALVAAILTVFIFGVTITASAAGVDIWNAVVQWTSETFGFSIKRESIWASPSSNPELAALRSALMKAEIYEQLVPNYMPDGYRQDVIVIDKNTFHASYIKDDSTIVVQIKRITGQNYAQHEKNNDNLEVYTVGGIEHYISTNMDVYVAAWQCNEFECLIHGAPTRQILQTMIDSIYMEELE